MVKLFILSAGLLLASTTSAQVDIVVSGGLHTIDVSAEDIRFKNSSDSFSLKFENASYGYHFGAGLRLMFNNFYLLPEVIFNSNEANYKFTNFSAISLYDSIKTEKYQYIDVPLIFGVKLSILRIHAGPVAHIFINNKSELTDIQGYSEKFKTATYGYRAGIGFDIAFFSLDLQHEGNFTNYGDHIAFFGNKLNFSKKASRLIGTLSIRF